MNLRVLIPVVALLLAGVLGYAGWRLAMQDGLGQAPAASFRIIDGRRIELAALRGRPVLVNFWATTCASCLREMPQLVRLYRDLSPHGLEIIGVAMSYDPPSYVLSMARQRPIPYPVALDPDGLLSRQFGDIELTPTTLLIAPDGRIVWRHTGLFNPHTLRQRVLDLLGAAVGT